MFSYICLKYFLNGVIFFTLEYKYCSYFEKCYSSNLNVLKCSYLLPFQTLVFLLYLTCVGMFL